MKYTYVLAALAAAVSAQDLSSIPTCVQNCLVSVVTAPGFGCGLTDFKCTCGKSASLTNDANTQCILNGCSGDDLKNANTVLNAFCAAAGVTINIPPFGSSPASSAPAAASSAPAAASSVVASSVVASSGAASYSAAPVSSKPVAASSTACTSTSTVTITVGKSSGAPYPTGGPKPSGPTGTAAPSGPAKYSSVPPQYTGAASSVEMPLALAGVAGIAAMLL